MYILRWIEQWGILNSKLNPREVQLYKSAEIRNQSDEMYILLIFWGPYWGRPIQCRRCSSASGNLYWVTFIDFVFVFLPFLHINEGEKRKSQEAMKPYKWDLLFTLDLVVTI